MSTSNTYKLKALLVVFFFAVSISVFPQNNKLEFDSEKGDFSNITGPIPFGEQVVIIGVSKSIPKSVRIKSSYGLTETISEASISGNKWSVKVGPFPKRTNIIFEITENSNLSSIETEEIIEYWESSIVSSIEKAIDSNLTFTSRQDFFNQIFNPLREEFLSRWNSYILANDQNLGTYIISLLENQILNNWNDWSTYSSGLREKNNLIQNSFFFKEYLIPNKNKVDEINEIVSAEDPVLLIFNLNQEEVNQLIGQILKVMNDSTLTESQLATVFNSEIERSKLNYMSSLSYYTNEINKLSIIRTQTIQVTHFTSTETLGVESYLGVDLGAVYTHNTSTTNFFVNLNPYFIKTDPALDYPLFKSNLLHNFTPSVGFGIGSGVENIKPVYFVGLGLRLNKAIRFGFGGTYYFSSVISKYDWNPSFYGSISINFVSDLFRLINSANTNIQN